VTPEASSLVEALLAAETRDQALVYVITSLGVIEELKSWWTGALSSKWSLDTIVAAASIVQHAVVFVFLKLYFTFIRLFILFLVELLCICYFFL